jgi:endonuclease-3 related protein
MGRREELLCIYERLNAHFGDLHWWPADGPFEVMVGAILTQNTAWSNVEKAIAALKERRLLSPRKLSKLDEETLAGIIRSSGYYHLKARRLKAFVRFFQDEYGGSVPAMSADEPPLLREKLLQVPGIGPETADSILLFACKKPVFVSDAYTRRILHRHHLIPENAHYDQIRSLFMANLSPDVSLFNQFHAMLVQTGKTFCGKRPQCDPCPLGPLSVERNSVKGGRRRPWR